VPTMATCLFWRTASPQYRARVDNFFTQIRTPIDFKREVGKDMDHSLMTIIGRLGLVIAAAIAVLVIFARDKSGRWDIANVLGVLFVAAFVATISWIMNSIGKRKALEQSEDEAEAEAESEADTEDTGEVSE